MAERANTWAIAQKGITMFGYSSSIDWSQFSSEERAILESLPHGSGIDCDWHIDKLTNGKIVAHNSYHVMSEHGFYIGYADFSIRWVPGKARDFRLMFHGSRAQYLNRQHMLRDYLEDTLRESIISELARQECAKHGHTWAWGSERWYCRDCFATAKSKNALIEPCLLCGGDVDAQAAICDKCAIE